MKIKGFTLIELVIYVGLTAILILVLSSVVSGVIRAKARNQAISEVENQGAQIMNQITQSLRNAATLNSPTAGSSAASLSLNSDTAGNNPTIFSISGTTLQISENGTVVALHNNLANASNLSFKNLARAGTPGSIQIQFTLAYNNTGNQVEYNYSKTFNGAAGLRQ